MTNEEAVPLDFTTDFVPFNPRRSRDHDLADEAQKRCEVEGEKQLIRAYAYTRVSKNPDGTKTSVEDQRRVLTERAAAEGFEILEWFEDDDEPASEFAKQRGRGKRPAFNRMSRQIRGGGADALLIYKFDRLIRDFVDWATLKGPDEHGKRPHNFFLYAVAEYVRTDTHIGEFMMMMLVGHAVIEVRNTSMRSKNKHTGLAIAGKSSGGRRPYGHTLDRKGVIAHEATIVNEIADRLLAGESSNAIARDLNDRGERTVNGRRWTVDALNGMMNSERLCGKRKITDTKLSDTSNMAVIIDEAKLRKVWVVLRGRKQGGRRAAPQGNYFLSGMLSCGDCGHVLSHLSAGKNRPKAMFACRKNAKDDHACQATYIDEGRAEDVAAEFALRRLERLDLDAYVAADDDEVTRLYAEITEAEASLSHIKHAYVVERIISRAEMAQMGEKFERLIAENTRRIEARVPRAAIASGSKIRAAWPEMSASERRTALRVAGVKTISVGPGLTERKNGEGRRPDYAKRYARMRVPVEDRLTFVLETGEDAGETVKLSAIAALEVAVPVAA